MQARRMKGQMNHQQREPGKAKGKDTPVTVHHFTAPSNYTGPFHHCISNSSAPPHSTRSSSSTRSFSSMRSSSFTGSTYCNPGNYTSFINHFPGPIHSTNVFTATIMQLYPRNLSGLEIELAMDNLLMVRNKSNSRRNFALSKRTTVILGCRINLGYWTASQLIMHCMSLQGSRH